MTCDNKLTKNITADCNPPAGGIEVKAWVLNRTDFDFTFSENKITDITPINKAKGLILTGYKKNFDAGHDAVISDTAPRRFAHVLSFVDFNVDSASKKSLDKVEDLVVIIERKEKPTGGDGVFVAYGAKTGLFVETDSQRFWENDSFRSIEMKTDESSLEPHSSYNVIKTGDGTVYAETLAMLEGLLT